MEAKQDEVLKYVPQEIFVVRAGKAYPKAPVIEVKTYPPGAHPKGSFIGGDYIAVEVKTPFGSRWFGTRKAFIDSSLRMVIGINPKDEVLAKWENYK